MIQRTLGRIVSLVFALLGLLHNVVGQEARFFRIVSEQPTQIVSLDHQGVLSWMNSVSNAPCWIEARDSMNGNWMSNFPSTTLRGSGLLSRARVPLYFAAGQIIVGFQDYVSEEQADVLVHSYGLVWQSGFPRLFTQWVKVLSGTPADYIPSLTSSGIVLWADHWAKPGGDPDAVYIQVQFNTLATQETALRLIASLPGLQPDSVIPEQKLGLVYVPVGTEPQWIAEFQTHPEVRYAELNGIISIDRGERSKPWPIP